MKPNNLIKKISLVFTTVFLFSLTAFAQTSTTEDWFVADKMVDCRGIVPQKCLVVREANSPDWKYFYTSINGFRFREGFTQKIRVQITPRRNVPADSSAFDYRLVRVLSQSRTNGNTLEEALRQIQNQKPLILDGKWSINEIDGVKVLTETTSMEFNAREKRFGAKICNGMGGDFEQNGSSLKFSRVIGTMMACPEPINSDERRFQQAIVKVNRGERNGDNLNLFAGNRLVMKLMIEQNSGGKTIEGVKWTLLEIENQKVSIQGQTPYLQLDKEKMSYSGFSGCNRIFGKYELNNNAINFGNGGMTRMACLDKEKQNIESRMNSALRRVNRFEIKNGVLTLYLGRNALLKFTANEIIEGVKWQLSELDGGRINLRDNLPYLQFDKQNMSFAGLAGCNRLFGKYEINVVSLKLSGIGMTKRACLDGERQNVERKMSQALSQVTRYEIKNGSLHLYGGNRLLMKFTAQ